MSSITSKFICLFSQWTESGPNGALLAPARCSVEVEQEVDREPVPIHRRHLAGRSVLETAKTYSRATSFRVKVCQILFSHKVLKILRDVSLKVTTLLCRIINCSSETLRCCLKLKSSLSLIYGMQHQGMNLSGRIESLKMPSIGESLE